MLSDVYGDSKRVQCAILLMTFAIDTMGSLVADVAVIKHGVWLQSPVLAFVFASLVIVYWFISSNDWFVNLILKLR